MSDIPLCECKAIYDPPAHGPQCLVRARIAALEAEVNRQKTRYARLEGSAGEWVDRMHAAEARAEALRRALEDIASTGCVVVTAADCGARNDEAWCAPCIAKGALAAPPAEPALADPPCWNCSYADGKVYKYCGRDDCGEEPALEEPCAKARPRPRTCTDERCQRPGLHTVFDPLCGSGEEPAGARCPTCKGWKKVRRCAPGKCPAPIRSGRWRLCGCAPMPCPDCAGGAE